MLLQPVGVIITPVQPMGLHLPEPTNIIRSSHCLPQVPTVSKHTFVVFLEGSIYVVLDILFRQITTSIKVRVAYVFGLQTLSSIDFSKIYQLKGLEPKNKGYL